MQQAAPYLAEGAQLLPPSARSALMRAAQTPGPSLTRTIEVDRAIQHVRRQWPERFRPECFPEIPDDDDDALPERRFAWRA